MTVEKGDENLSHLWQPIKVDQLSNFDMLPFQTELPCTSCNYLNKVSLKKDLQLWIFRPHFRSILKFSYHRPFFSEAPLFIRQSKIKTIPHLTNVYDNTGRNDSQSKSGNRLTLAARCFNVSETFPKRRYFILSRPPK